MQASGQGGGARPAVVSLPGSVFNYSRVNSTNHSVRLIALTFPGERIIREEVNVIASLDITEKSCLMDVIYCFSK